MFSAIIVTIITNTKSGQGRAGGKPTAAQQVERVAPFGLGLSARCLNPSLGYLRALTAPSRLSYALRHPSADTGQQIEFQIPQIGLEEVVIGWAFPT